MMANEYVNKVLFGGQTVMDITDTTATHDKVLTGYSAYGADGSLMSGDAANLVMTETLDPHGGTVLTITGEPAYGYNWMGYQAEYVQQLGTFSVALANTDFATWTPSTTAKTIRATSNLTTFSASMTSYDYLIRWQFDFTAAYPTGTTTTVAPKRQFVELWQAIIRRPRYLSDMEASSFNYNVCLTFFTAPGIIYYNSSGTQTLAYTSSYGIYPGATAATFSSATSASPTVTVKLPTISARCSTTYMSTAMAGVIDQQNSIVKMRADLFRSAIGAPARSMYEGLADLYHYPL